MKRIYDLQAKIDDLEENLAWLRKAKRRDPDDPALPLDIQATEEQIAELKQQQYRLELELHKEAFGVGCH